MEKRHKADYDQAELGNNLLSLTKKRLPFLIFRRRENDWQIFTAQKKAKTAGHALKISGLSNVEFIVAMHDCVYFQ